MADPAAAKQPLTFRVHPGTLLHLKRRARGDKVDEWIDRARAIAEREEARWRRRGEALG